MSGFNSVKGNCQTKVYYILMNISALSFFPRYLVRATYKWDHLSCILVSYRITIRVSVCVCMCDVVKTLTRIKYSLTERTLDRNHYSFLLKGYLKNVGPFYPFILSNSQTFFKPSSEQKIEKHWTHSFIASRTTAAVSFCLRSEAISLFHGSTFWLPDATDWQLSKWVKIYNIIFQYFFFNTFQYISISFNVIKYNFKPLNLLSANKSFQTIENPFNSMAVNNYYWYINQIKIILR